MPEQLKDIYQCKVCGRFIESQRHCGTKAAFIIDGERRLRLSKLMSAILRHIAKDIGLNVTKDGWVSISEMVSKIKQWKPENYSWVENEHVVAIAEVDAKGRFEVSGGLIRARYGHTMDVEIPLPEDNEVSVLYHGTSSSNLKDIMEQGIKPMERRKVHLTSSLEEALESARRKGIDVVILEVDARKLRSKGYKTLKAGKHVYVTDYVPPDCIRKMPRAKIAKLIASSSRK
ncbi:MAG: RNA 2'-phosphotransferase [Candidatus Methanomethylicota archaeon]|uniref:Probable RNA 2'-phosphotransferase n=1 Tax=Thermoproteota archaeon TaxID=2056631 RepID=A0A497F398_9CREN|nr:MAG: RNA 2'-phosphotransferase [Candidatus Verstraetearchaeota archaeon]